MGNQ